MEAPLLTSRNIEMPSDLSYAKNAPLVVVPWSKFGTRRLYVDTADGRHVGWVDLKTGRRSLAIPGLAQAFDVAVTEAEAALAADHTQKWRGDLLEVCGADNPADGEPALMRHAYRGKCAYSSWELGPGGNRLVAEDLDQLVSVDPHWAYLGSTFVG